MSRSMSFLINDASTETNIPQVRVTITESASGTLSFSVSQEGGIVGDLRGLFFDLADESLLGSLSTATANTGFRQGNDSVKDLGEGVNMNGLTGSDSGFDVGIKIGTAGIGKDDIRSYNFTLSSSARALTIEDFANVEFGVRLTSVGTLGGSRNGSSKVVETTSAGVYAIDDASGAVVENGSASGNVFANDTAAAGSVNTVTSWTGGALGSTVALNTDDADALNIGSVTLGGNGQWVVSVDGVDADQLSAGESITRTFNYDVKNTSGSETGDWSSDSATFTVVINGQNDGPVAVDDVVAAISEDDSIVNASVTGNDSDVDRLDTHTWALESGSFKDAAGNAAQGSLMFNADGTWSYDTAGAYNNLSAGESVALSFQYAMIDNNGASSIATASFTIEGQNDGPVALDDVVAAINEDGSIVNASVTGNDSDVDRLDTHTWSLQAGSFKDAVGNTAQGSLVFNADGTWSYDTAGAYNSLSVGESVVQSFEYKMTDNNGASSVATASFTINGQNDGPVAVNDVVVAAITEDGSIVNASVTGNDSDVDRLDTHTWALQANSFTDAAGNAAKGSLVFNADGTWSYDAEGAYNSLNDGQSVSLSFQYAMIDNNGASSLATVSFTIDGKGSAPVVLVPEVPVVTPPPVQPPVAPPAVTPAANDFVTWAQDISHFTLVFDTAAGDTAKGNDGFYTVKFDFDPEVRDLDSIIGEVLAGLIANDPVVDASTDLLGVVIKGGHQITNFYAYGDNNTNGDLPDVLPNVKFSLDGTKAGEVNPSAIDVVYGDGFIY